MIESAARAKQLGRSDPPDPGAAARPLCRGARRRDPAASAWVSGPAFASIPAPEDPVVCSRTRRALRQSVLRQRPVMTCHEGWGDEVSSALRLWRPWATALLRVRQDRHRLSPSPVRSGDRGHSRAYLPMCRRVRPGPLGMRGQHGLIRGELRGLERGPGNKNLQRRTSENWGKSKETNLPGMPNQTARRARSLRRVLPCRSRPYMRTGPAMAQASSSVSRCGRPGESEAIPAVFK